MENQKNKWLLNDTYSEYHSDKLIRTIKKVMDADYINLRTGLVVPVQKTNIAVAMGRW